VSAMEWNHDGAFVVLAAARSILLIGRHDDELARWPWRGRKAK